MPPSLAVGPSNQVCVWARGSGLRKSRWSGIWKGQLSGDRLTGLARPNALAVRLCEVIDRVMTAREVAEGCSGALTQAAGAQGTPSSGKSS